LTDLAEKGTEGGPPHGKASPPAVDLHPATTSTNELTPRHRASPHVRPRGPDRGQERARRGRRHLRLLLVGSDFGVAWLTWIVVLILARPDEPVWVATRAFPFSVFMGVVTCALAWSQRLYQSRICALRSAEVTRLWRVVVVSGLIAFAIGRYGQVLQPWVVVTAAGATFVTLVMGRSIYADWLRLSRSHGYFVRPVCLIGSNDEAEDLAYLLGDHPELGYRITGVIGDQAEWLNRVPNVPVLQAGTDPAQTVRSTGATGVVVAASALSVGDRERLIGRLIADGIHVQLSAGFNRLGHNRMWVSPLAHQLTFYVEPPQLSGGQAVIKRALDLVVGASILAVSIPLVALAALLIKLEDGGSVLYRQERVGLRGRTFEVLKLRTMVPDASQKLGELRERNERQGPLFKVTADPRVTRVGRFLRTTSIDELPQLVNVLRGEMSIVGPRPALPSEFAQFDSDLTDRAQVPPGITGLWQVEARDNPSFRAYRRLDLFYVDNWSVAFDLAIMAGTARMLLVRLATAIWSPGASGRIGSDRRIPPASEGPQQAA
jgi:exopolysaccharide biosynthesis polyprenyl glycosylphosphotransferase